MLTELTILMPLNPLQFNGIYFDDYVIESDRERAHWAYMCKDCAEKVGNDKHFHIDDNLCPDVTCSVLGCDNQDDVDYVDFMTSDFCFITFNKIKYPVEPNAQAKGAVIMPFPTFAFNAAELALTKPKDWEEIVTDLFNQSLNTDGFKINNIIENTFVMTNDDYELTCSFTGKL